MSQQLDHIMYNISTAARTCFSLNTHVELSDKEQIVFYQYAEKITMIITYLLQEYDTITTTLHQSEQQLSELNTIWTDTNASLIALSRAITSPKLRTAVAETAFAIDKTLSMHQTFANRHQSAAKATL